MSILDYSRPPKGGGSSFYVLQESSNTGGRRRYGSFWMFVNDVSKIVLGVFPNFG
jgi:hypothetical protein